VLVVGGEDFGRKLRHEGGSLINGNSAFIRRDIKQTASLGSVRRQLSENQKSTFTRHHICRHTNLGLPSIQNCKK
jgi:hypothetical protein